MTHQSGSALRLLQAISLLFPGACGSVTLPDTPPDLAYESAKTKVSGNVQVTVAVLGSEESEKVFGVPLFKEGIQPIWMRIENRDEIGYFFQSISVDPNLFPPLEVAYKFYSRVREE